LGSKLASGDKISETDEIEGGYEEIFPGSIAANGSAMKPNAQPNSAIFMKNGLEALMIGRS
jgi:hypothetical protein